MNFNANSAPPYPRPNHVPWWATGRLYKIQMRRGALGLLDPICVNVSYSEADGSYCVNDTTNAYVSEQYQGLSQDLFYELSMSISFDESLSKSLAKSLRDIGVDCYGLFTVMAAATSELDGSEYETLDCVILISHPEVPKRLKAPVSTSAIDNILPFRT